MTTDTHPDPCDYATLVMLVPYPPELAIMASLVEIDQDTLLYQTHLDALATAKPAVADAFRAKMLELSVTRYAAVLQSQPLPCGTRLIMDVQMLRQSPSGATGIHTVHDVPVTDEITAVIRNHKPSRYALSISTETPAVLPPLPATKGKAKVFRYTTKPPEEP